MRLGIKGCIFMTFMGRSLLLARTVCGRQERLVMPTYRRR